MDLSWWQRIYKETCQRSRNRSRSFYHVAWGINQWKCKWKDSNIGSKENILILNVLINNGVIMRIWSEHKWSHFTKLTYYHVILSNSMFWFSTIRVIMGDYNDGDDGGDGCGCLSKTIFRYFSWQIFFTLATTRQKPTLVIGTNILVILWFHLFGIVIGLG